VTEPRDEDRRDEAREDEVSRLLAAAGAQRPPTPPEVAERLDDELARLVAERTDGRPRGDHLGGPVLPAGVVGADQLASRRRRRWPQALVAAAAVSVVGLGVATVVDDGSGGGDAAMSSDAAGGQAEAEAADPPPASTLGEGSMRLQGTPRVRSAALRTDVRRIRERDLFNPARPRVLSQACITPRIGAGDEWTRVRFDGFPAVLVLRAPADGRRTADVFTCAGTLEPVASTTISAR
jgi:hypothetical protein